MSQDKQTTLSTFKDKLAIVINSKSIACQIVGIPDFAFITKIQLAVALRNMVIDFHNKATMIINYEERVRVLEAENNILHNKVISMNTEATEQNIQNILDVGGR